MSGDFPEIFHRFGILNLPGMLTNKCGCSKQVSNDTDHQREGLNQKKKLTKSIKSDENSQESYTE